MTTSPADVRHPAASADTAPTRRTLLVLSTLYVLLFLGNFLVGGAEIPEDATGGAVIQDFTTSAMIVKVSGYAMVVTAALVVFWGAGVRRALGGRSWAADVVALGALAMGITLVGWAVTLFALDHAVDSGVPEVAQAVNILNGSNFVPAMLALLCTMVGAGVAGLRTGRLPRWLALVSIGAGLLAPLGPGAFVPFLLFPFWTVVVSALVRLEDSEAV